MAPEMGREQDLQGDRRWKKNNTIKIDVADSKMNVNKKRKWI